MGRHHVKEVVRNGPWITVCGMPGTRSRCGLGFAAKLPYRLDVMLDRRPQDTNLGHRSLRPYECEVDTVGVGLLGGTRVALVLPGGRVGSRPSLTGLLSVLKQDQTVGREATSRLEVASVWHHGRNGITSVTSRRVTTPMRRCRTCVEGARLRAEKARIWGEEQLRTVIIQQVRDTKRFEG